MFSGRGQSRVVVGTVLVGWAGLVVCLGWLGAQPQICLIVATLGLVAVGVPIGYRSPAAASVACLCVLLAGAAFGVVSRKAQDDAQAYATDHPPASTTTTTQTWVWIDREPQR